MRPVELSDEALYSVLLHALKHPSSAVAGLLLGTTGGEAVAVTAALPVCHGFVTLAPLLEAAMAQAEVHAKAAGGGLRLLGYYQANERLADGELGAGRRVADRLEAACPDAVALVLDAPALDAALKAAAAGQAEPEAPVLALFQKDGARGWVRSKGLRCASKGVGAQVAQYASRGLHLAQHDFEEHLEDVGRDWLNPGLLQGPA